MSPVVVVLVTIALIVLSAFFVIVEFALRGARQHRLEADAEHSAAARAALRGVNELTMMLAGAQLGITVCTFALGAVTKPAVDAWLGPVLVGWGVPGGVAYGASFALSLLFVTFLHLVVGEMAPKSWAIAHPEVSAKAVSIPARAFIWAVRPLLSWVNSLANRLVAASGVEPVDRAAVGGQDVDTIRHLVEHSAQAGVLDRDFHSQLSQVLELEALTVGDLVPEGDEVTGVEPGATAADVQAAAADSRHLRVLVDVAGPRPGYVHVRDTLLEPTDAVVDRLVRPALVLPAGTPVYESLSRIRAASEQLAVVVRDEDVLGVVTIADILRRVLPLGVDAAADNL